MSNRLTVYSYDGGVRCELCKYQYNGQFMGDRTVTATVSSPVRIDFAYGDYITLRGQVFKIYDTPSAKKQSRRGEVSNGFVYENIVFHSIIKDLVNVKFKDYVLENGNTVFTGFNSFAFYMANITDLSERLQANLNRAYGTGVWNVVVATSNVCDDSGKVIVKGETITFKKQSVSISIGSNLLDGLNLYNSLFDLHYIITVIDGVNTIVIGGTSIVNDNDIFGVGKGRGFISLKQNRSDKDAVITRLHAYGSTRNMPYRYYNDYYNDESKFPSLFSDGTYLLNSAYFKNLMLPYEDWYIDEGTFDVYLDSINTDVYGIREFDVVFDGSDKNWDEIYPSLEGMKPSDIKPGMTGYEEGFDGSKPTYRELLIKKLMSYGHSKDASIFIVDNLVVNRSAPKSENGLRSWNVPFNLSDGKNASLTVHSKSWKDAVRYAFGYDADSVPYTAVVGNYSLNARCHRVANTKLFKNAIEQNIDGERIKMSYSGNYYWSYFSSDTSHKYYPSTLINVVKTTLGCSDSEAYLITRNFITKPSMWDTGVENYTDNGLNDDLFVDIVYSINSNGYTYTNGRIHNWEEYIDKACSYPSIDLSLLSMRFEGEQYGYDVIVNASYAQNFISYVESIVSERYNSSRAEYASWNETANTSLLNNTYTITQDMIDSIYCESNRLDMFRGGSSFGDDNITDNGCPIDDGMYNSTDKDTEGNYMRTDFKVYIPQIFFNPIDVATDDGVKLEIKTGKCAGRSFEVLNSYTNTSFEHGYVLVCSRDDSDLSSTGMVYPNSVFNIELGDEYVLTGISMPAIYVESAEQRLKTQALEYLAKYEQENYTYTPQIDNIYLYEHPEIAEGIVEGMALKFTDKDPLDRVNNVNENDLNIGLALIHIKQLTIKYNEGALPHYEIQLDDNVDAVTIQNIINTQISRSIVEISSGSSSFSKSSGISFGGDYLETDQNGNVKDDATFNKDVSVKGYETVDGSLSVGKEISSGGNIISSGDITANGKISSSCSTINGESIVKGNHIVSGDLIVGAFDQVPTGSENGVLLKNDGTIIAKKMELSEELVVPSIQYNKAVTLSGVVVLSSVAGKIESVEKLTDTTGKITLKLENGEYPGIVNGCYLLGFWHNLVSEHNESYDRDGDYETVGGQQKLIRDGNIYIAGFASIYFKATSDATTEEDGSVTFTYELRPSDDSFTQKGYHPVSGMSFYGFGHATNSDMQSIYIITKDYRLQLVNKTKWTYDGDNIVDILGNLNGFWMRLNEIDSETGEYKKKYFTGYGHVTGNLSIYGSIKQFDRGKFITGQQLHYYRSAIQLPSGVKVTDVSGWSTTLPAEDDAKKFLYEYWSYDYSDGTTDTSEVFLVGSKGDSGSTPVVYSLVPEQTGVNIDADGKYSEERLSVLVQKNDNGKITPSVTWGTIKLVVDKEVSVLTDDEGNVLDFGDDDEVSFLEMIDYPAGGILLGDAEGAIKPTSNVKFILLDSDNVCIDTKTIPFNTDSKGQKGDRGAFSIRRWEDCGIGDTFYVENKTNGIVISDIVIDSGGDKWLCKKNFTIANATNETNSQLTKADATPQTGSKSSTYWTAFNSFNNVATGLLLADKALINNLLVENVQLTNGDGQVYGGMTPDADTTLNNGDIRFWLGSNTPSSAPARIDKNGNAVMNTLKTKSMFLDYATYNIKNDHNYNEGYVLNGVQISVDGASTIAAYSIDTTDRDSSLPINYWIVLPFAGDCEGKVIDICTPNFKDYSNGNYYQPVGVTALDSNGTPIDNASESYTDGGFYTQWGMDFPFLCMSHCELLNNSSKDTCKLKLVSTKFGRQYRWVILESVNVMMKKQWSVSGEAILE